MPFAQFLRLISYQTGLSKGINTPQLIGNLFRLSGLAIGIWVVYLGKGLNGLALSILLGEIISMISLVFWLKYREIASIRGIVLTAAAIISTTYALLIAKEQLPVFGSIGMIAIGSLSSLIVLGIGKITAMKSLKLMYPGTS